MDGSTPDTDVPAVLTAAGVDEIKLSADDIAAVTAANNDVEEASFALTEAQIATASADLAVKRAVKRQRLLSELLAAKHGIDPARTDEKWSFTGTSFKSEKSEKSAP